jgi:hypothetical protein
VLWIVDGGRSPLGSKRNAIDSDHRLLLALPTAPARISDRTESKQLRLPNLFPVQEEESETNLAHPSDTDGG